MVIAAILVLQRPSLLTWSFFLIALSVQPGAWTQAFLSDRLIVTYTFLANASVIAGAAASVIFAMLFPRTQPSPAIRRTAEALAFFGIALLIFDTANGYSQIFGWVTHGSAAWAALVKALTYRAMVGLSVTAIVMFGINYLRSLPRERLRMQWVALGFAVGNCGSALPLVLGGFFGVEMPLAAVNAMLALTIFIPVSVAYAIAKHRVLDIRFFLSRALIYSCVSVIIVGTFVLAEWAAGTWLAGLTHATGPAVVIATALGLGLSLRPIYALADNLVNTVLFKKQFQARALLARMGAGLPYAESTDGIMDVLTRGVCENLQLVSAALFRRDESGLFRREAAYRWGPGDDLQETDIRQLSAAFEGSTARSTTFHSRIPQACRKARANRTPRCRCISGGTLRDSFSTQLTRTAPISTQTNANSSLHS